MDGEKWKQYNVPIRIGINSGSIEKVLLDKYGHCCAEAMIESAQKHIDILEKHDFHDICLSFNSSNVIRIYPCLPNTPESAINS